MAFYVNHILIKFKNSFISKKYTMKKLIILIVLVPIFFACNKEVEGNLVGAKDRNPFYTDILGPGNLPYGMVYIQSGSFQMGGGKEIMGEHSNKIKTVTLPAYYMDATEISNNEYRQFVNWVKDSIAREKLYRRSYGDDASRWVNIPDNFFKQPYRTIVDMGSDVQGGNTPFQKFMDSSFNSAVDKIMLGLVGNTSEAKIRDRGALVNGYELNKKYIQDKSKKFDIVMTPDEVREFSGIFQQYSNTKINDGINNPITNQKPDIIDPKEKTDDRKKYDQGGRLESRKYFTLNYLEPIDYTDPETSFLLSDMYYSKAEQYGNRKQIDTRLLFFEYSWIDLKEAAKRGKISATGITKNNYNLGDLSSSQRRQPLGKDHKSNDYHRSTLDPNRGNKVWVDTTVYGAGKQFGQPSGESSDFETYKINDPNNLSGTILENPGQDLDLGYTNSKGEHNAIRGHTDRSRFIINEKINIYPDTLCWIRDFTYKESSDLASNYFWNSAYDNYPVVGVSWQQAKAFSVWRSQIFNSWLESTTDIFVNDFRLPTEAQWERASRGGLESADYPWGGPYIRNSSGCFLANFKPMRGSYFEDGGVHTVKVYSYNPNGFGLYCMAGNVAEWCSSTFNESSNQFVNDLSGEYDYNAKDGDTPVDKRKVIRGGSWKDIGYYLLNSTRTFEYQDSAKTYIGFRNTMSHLGRGGKEIEKENGEEIQSDIQLK